MHQAVDTLACFTECFLMECKLSDLVLPTFPDVEVRQADSDVCSFLPQHMACVLVCMSGKILVCKCPTG
jgi:hypothetical protein